MITGIIIGALIGSAIITVLGIILYIVFCFGKLLLMKLIEPIFWGVVKALWWIADTIEELIDRIKTSIKKYFCLAV